MTEGFIPPHGGYRKLLSYQRAEVVYDATVRFCQRYFDRRDRTVDQMAQAARSGKQNIIEASMASGTSKETDKIAVENPAPAIAANAIIGLIKTATYLLDRQPRQLEQAFLKEGGIRERMTRARIDHRDRHAATRRAARSANEPPPYQGGDQGEVADAPLQNLP